MGVAVLLVIALFGWSQRDGYMNKKMLYADTKNANATGSKCKEVVACLLKCQRSNDKSLCVKKCAAMPDNKKYRCFGSSTGTVPTYQQILKDIGYETKYE